MSNPIHSTSAKSVLPMLAMRGLATGLCAGCVVGLLRLSHDRAAARVALWLEEWREVWWTVPIWFGVLVALAVILRRIVREERSSAARVFRRRSWRWPGVFPLHGGVYCSQNF